MAHTNDMISHMSEKPCTEMHTSRTKQQTLTTIYSDGSTNTHSSTLAALHLHASKQGHIHVAYSAPPASCSFSSRATSKFSLKLFTKLYEPVTVANISSAHC